MPLCRLLILSIIIYLKSLYFIFVLKRYFCRMWDFDDSSFFMAERSLAIYVLSPL